VKTILAELARLEGRVWVATRAEIAAHFRRVVR
jgi:hypothetical protein